MPSLDKDANNNKTLMPTLVMPEGKYNFRVSKANGTAPCSAFSP